MEIPLRKFAIAIHAMLAVTLIITASSEEVDLESLLGTQVKTENPSEVKVGVPLYRTRAHPEVLIPATRLESLNSIPLT